MKRILVSEAQRSDGETTDGWIPGMSLPSVSGRLSAPLRFALKSPVSSIASRQDEIANFVSRFHGILGHSSKIGKVKTTPGSEARTNRHSTKLNRAPRR